MFITNTSKLILRHSKIFKYKNIFFSGNIQDTFPSELSTLKTKIHIQKYYNKLQFDLIKKNKKIDICHNYIITHHMTRNYNILIYYWPKDKKEAYFQLMNLFSSLFTGTEIFIVGENNSGVNSASKMLHQWVKLNILDRAKHCVLSHGILIKKSIFIIKNFFHTHIYNNISIKSLPGVFGYKKIDSGSKLLASTFSNQIKGSILDIGCGSGFLSVLLHYYSPNIQLTLIDNNKNALISSLSTLKENNIEGKVLLSDLYSNVSEKFNMIISNPPFHNDLKLNFQITKKIIVYSVKYLRLSGELRFVTNICFSYDNLLKKIFKKYTVLKKNKKYKVYQAFLI
ncbi:16S rRNA (guanine(1207)-N(2))-methyltransferase RsmC [Buchnera aphidicola]|uniref:16S rRNA (guanine(1207)-N(2))-methyltransferase RsmC n=1 Tax=Buchnera aphidicola TaxID=9 RepID=UPI003BEEBCDC